MLLPLDLPNAGEGLGVRGIPLTRTNARKRSTVRVSELFLLRVANYSDTFPVVGLMCTVTRIGSPLPNVGEGFGGEGDFTTMNQFRETRTG
jgi:hypothetical protein